MGSEEVDVRTLSYQDRRLLIVDDARRLAVQAARDDDRHSPSWAGVAVGTGVAGAVVGAVVGVLAQQLVETATRQRARRREEGRLPLLIIGQKEAENLSFPFGHPLKGVVYVGHPGIAGAYLPMATFHRVLFNEKAAEALRLLRSLAADEINIEYIEGFSQSGVVNFAISSPPTVPVAGAAHAGRSDRSSSTARVTMHFDPDHEPAIPHDLMWYYHEPLWREVAEGRMASGLRDFQIEVLYSDDFEVDAKLEAKIAQVGLSAGGSFTEFRNTTWKLSGTFKPIAS